MTVPMKFKMSPILGGVKKQITLLIRIIKNPPIWGPGFGTVRETYTLMFFFVFLLALLILKLSEYGHKILPPWFYSGCCK